MYSKIAAGNVKKSYKDYSIYFLTLTLAVSIFYSFNSIESQKAVMEMTASSEDYVDVLIRMIDAVSVFVSVILGGLILYANNFLIKKRKKELGIYMSLGMGKQKISKILVIETLIVGAISLLSGILIGIGLSQGLSVFTASLFDVGMSEYKFIISGKAILKTSFYFCILFVLVILFNTFIISRYKIIDLLVAGRKNEDIKFKNPLVYLVTFILCVVSLGFAYKIILEIGLNPMEPMFKVSIGLGILGTLLFFYSLAGFGLYVFKNNKKIYFKNLNIFIIKQMNSKINTNFLSMSIICLMLFLTMGILSTGLSFKSALEGGLEDTTPFNVSSSKYIYEETEIDNIEEVLNKLGLTFDESEKYVFFDEYDSNTSLKDMGENKGSKSNNKIDENMQNMKAYLIKESSFNDIRELNGKEKISLEKNEVLVTSNNTKMMDVLNDFLENNKTLKLDNKTYNIKNEKVVKQTLKTSTMAENIFTIVIKDDVVEDFEKISTNVNVVYTGDKEKSEKKFRKFINDFRYADSSVYDEVGYIMSTTRDEVYEDTKGMTTTILFIGIYLGIVFLISSMAVLALQQLSEASDSIDRYKSLRKIGANDKMINRSIFIQTMIYFSLPVGLAFVHSVVGIKVANDFIAIYNKPDIGGSSLMTALVFMVVYVGYFVSTYTGYKNIIKNS